MGIFPNEITEHIYDQCDVIARAKLATTCQYFKSLWKKQGKSEITYMLKFKTITTYNRMKILSEKITLNQSMVQYDLIDDKIFGEKWIKHEEKLYSQNTSTQINRLIKYFKLEPYFINRKYSNGYNKINIEICYSPNGQREICCTRPVQRHIKTIERNYF